jgi:hypothetical protein
MSAPPPALHRQGRRPGGERERQERSPGRRRSGGQDLGVDPAWLDALARSAGPQRGEECQKTAQVEVGGRVGRRRRLRTDRREVGSARARRRAAVIRLERPESRRRAPGRAAFVDARLSAYLARGSSCSRIASAWTSLRRSTRLLRGFRRISAGRSTALRRGIHRMGRATPRRRGFRTAPLAQVRRSRSAPSVSAADGPRSACGVS